MSRGPEQGAQLGLEDLVERQAEPDSPEAERRPRSGDAGVVERFVSNLRRKIDADGPALIHTVRGFGYTIRADEGPARVDPARADPA